MRRREAALIGRLDRRGTLLWSLPKGHIEAGETAGQTAIREVHEETGIDGVVLAELGSIDYWFVVENRRVHKTVHHFLLEATGGELSDEDVEVTEVAWVALGELDELLAYADERRLVRRAIRLLADGVGNGTDEAVHGATSNGTGTNKTGTNGSASDGAAPERSASTQATANRAGPNRTSANNNPNNNPNNTVQNNEAEPA